MNVIAGAISGTLSGSFSGSVDVSGGRLIGVLVSGTFSGSVDVSSGKLNNSVGHLTLSSSAGSVVGVSGNFQASGSHTFTGSLSIAGGPFLAPRMTNTQKDALVAVAGLIIYNTDSGSFQFYDTTWKIVTIV